MTSMSRRHLMIAATGIAAVAASPRIAFAQPRVVNARGKTTGHAADRFVRVRTAPEAVVVHEKVAASGREVQKKIDEGVASHD